MAEEASQLAEWLTLARQGDESARNQLFAACRSYLAVVARVHLQRRLQTKVDPSDLVQQSLLEAHQGFDEFRGQSPEDWLAWLKQVVQHNALDVDKHHRQAAKRDYRREQSFSTDESASTAAWTPVDSSPSPSQFAVQTERELRLAEAIEELPDDYRRVILLRNVERLPFEEVAVQMDRSRGACQMLWARAVDQLRTRFQSDAS